MAVATAAAVAVHAHYVIIDRSLIAALTLSVSLCGFLV